MRPSGRRPSKLFALLAAFVAAILGFLLLVTSFASAPVVEPSLTANAGSSNTAISPGSSGSSPTVNLGSPDSGREAASESFLKDGQAASIRWDKDTGAPVFLTGSITPPAGESPFAEAVAFLGVNKDIFQMTDPVSELVAGRQSVDEIGMAHVQMAQVYKGVPVFGAGMAVHFSADNKIQTVNGHYIPGIAVSTDPDISVDAAVSTALSDYSAPAAASSFEPPLLVIYSQGGTQSILAWKITLANEDPPARMVYFVDAHNGAIAAHYDALEAAKNRRTYTAGNGTSIPGTLLITEGGSSSDYVVQAAHDNIGLTYDYYFNTFGRDSYNGAGATLTSTVHYSNGYNNAYWNGQQMVYGDGDGNVFSPLSLGLDVVAHELTHGVTQSTADLVYSYQSGALNESYSDVFGAMVDRDDWLMGEDVYTPHTPGDALRSLSNPTLYGQPDNMSNYVNTTSDNGGVHTNSGIPNKAAYNIATAIGKDKMEKIWYRTLTVYLNSGSQFTDARDASVQAATDLYGSNGPEVLAVQNGFAAVGIGAGQTSNQTARIEINHTYRGDLVVTLGVGDPASPAWSTVVSNRAGGSADNIYQTVDISAAAAQLPPNWQNRWYLKVYDAAGQDQGSIVKFAITDNGTTYTAVDTPAPVLDYQTVYSYLPSQDSTPPTVQAVSPANGATAYTSTDVSASFSEDLRAASVTPSSLTLTRHDTGAPVAGTVTYDGAHRTINLNPTTNLAYSTMYDAKVSVEVTDLAGNHLAQDYTWSFSTSPIPKLYYFTWYDQQSSGMKDWIVMGNPATEVAPVGFDVYVGGQKMTESPMIVTPGNSSAASFAGTMGGPVKTESLDGKQEIVSKRTLFSDSFEEITALAEDRLDSTYYFTWYDSQSNGARNWVLVANPGATPLDADIYIAGQKMNATPYHIAAGGNVTPEFPGVMSGPVMVVGYEPGNPLTPRQIIASQRVLWNGRFNEVVGIPSRELENEYLFTWYDNQSAGAKDWVLIANPNNDKQLAAEIWIGGQRMTNSATGDQYFEVPPGKNVTPLFAGVMNGPVVVRGYDAATYVPDAPGNTALKFYTTQRSLFGQSFEEVSGYGVGRLSSIYHFSWYDQVSAGSRNWVLVTNPTASEVKAEVWIAGTRMTVLTIAPGATETPTFPGVMSGPVEVRGYDSATYNPNNPGTPNRNVFTSQRVMWNGNFNEVEGMVLN